MAVRIAIIGAGLRAQYAYAPYALEHPDEVSVVAVAEPDAARRQRMCDTYGIPAENAWTSWEELLAAPVLADAVIIGTQDRMHYEPCMKALEKGYHVLLEKPMSPSPEECVAMTRQAEKYGRILTVCHVLRYTAFFRAIKDVIESGRLGDIVTIQHNENVAHWHQAHSFVRGNWGRKDDSAPMILAKCCHDMDILSWLVGKSCLRLSSFGSLTHFTPEHAPEGAPARCTDGCPHEAACPYSAIRQYVVEGETWPQTAISNDFSLEARRKAIEEGPYGRCVYHCGNDVVDHQVVSMEFEGGITVAFTMSAFTAECTRTLKIMGTKAELRGHMEHEVIEVTDFLTRKTEVVPFKAATSGHGGGDSGIMGDFVALLDGRTTSNLTSAEASMMSHLMAFAAEESRLDGTVRNMDAFRSQFE